MYLSLITSHQHPLIPEARRLRKDPTDVEALLWWCLRRKHLGVRFRRQAPIGPFIADFACFDPRLIIEADGSQHYEDGAARYDAARDRWFHSRGFVVLRFDNDEVLRDLEVTVGEIRDTLETLGVTCP